MMRRAVALMLAVAASLCVSCSTPGYLHVLNASGAPIVLRLRPYYFEPTSVRLKPGGWAKIIRFRAPLPGPIILAQGCAHIYVLPDVPLDHPLNRGIDDVVQVNPDLSLMLLPTRSSAGMPAAALKEMQPPGFPVRPSSVDCRQP